MRLNFTLIPIFLLIAIILLIALFRISLQLSEQQSPQPLEKSIKGNLSQENLPVQQPLKKPTQETLQPSEKPIQQPSQPLHSRSFKDNPDNYGGSQVHVMYVLPSDGTDRELDLNGVLERSVLAFNNWLAGQAGGRKLRLDTYSSGLDITFYQLKRTDAQIASHGVYVRDEIEKDLKAAGFDQTNKIYAVYYDGSSNYACGGGAWPPTLPGNVAALYLWGRYGLVDCSLDQFTSNQSRVGIQEFKMLHEILHTLGFVATCAPHHTRAGHVSDDNRDLMYAGGLDWTPSVLDRNNDDYFNHNNANCLDLADSSFLQ